MQKLAVSNKIRRALILKTGQTTAYAAGDDGTYQIGESHNYEILTTGQYSGTTNITINGKTDVHSNACVLDRSTGLMWSRTLSASVGPTSNGFLPWTTNGSGEGIFTYAAAANLALFAGHGNDPDPLKNWRVPNKFEIFAQDKGEPGSYLDSTAFPSIGAVNIWSSSVQKNNVANGSLYLALQGQIGGLIKTGSAYVLLVRGPS